MSKILDHLYLGSYKDALDIEALKMTGVTHILNTVDEPDPARRVYSTRPEYYGPDFKYHSFTSHDDNTYPIMDHFEECWEFVEDARRCGGRCLIHCMVGVNRSGVLAVAYVMVHLNIDLVTAVKVVHGARGALLSNSTFVERLVRFAAKRNSLIEVSVSDP